MNADNVKKGQKMIKSFKACMMSPKKEKTDKGIEKDRDKERRQSQQGL